MLKHQNKHMEYKDKDHIQFRSQKKPTVHEREVMHVCVCVCVCVCVYTKNHLPGRMWPGPNTSACGLSCHVPCIWIAH